MPLLAIAIIFCPSDEAEIRSHLFEVLLSSDHVVPPSRDTIIFPAITPPPAA